MLRRVGLAAPLLVFGLVTAQAETPANNNSDTYRQLDLFASVLDRVKKDYVEEVPDEVLVEYALKGMLGSLDPHSSYMNPKDYKEFQSQISGKFGGLGIEVTMEDGLVKVVTPIDDTPAARAGLKPGDLIAFIDGEPVKGLSLGEAVDKLRGDVDTPVKLTVLRAKADPFDVTLRRAIVKVKAVKFRREGELGYLRITSFQQEADNELRQALAKMDQEPGGPIKGLLLDLRNNPGGSLDQAVTITDMFLEKGEIVSTRGRNGADTKRSQATSGDLLAGKPLVILINGGSASASEIVSGALKDHRRAVLMGTRSFGKGSVQTVLPLTPYKGGLRITTARYYTPSGRSIQAEGIDPDIVVEVPQFDDEKRAKIPEKLKSQSEADLRGHLSADNGPDKKQDAAHVIPKLELPPEVLAIDKNAAPAKPDETDYQLRRGLDLLRGLVLYSGKQASIKQ